MVGNLRSNSLAEIWQGSEMLDLRIKMLDRKRHEIEGCKDCTYLHTAPDCMDELTSAEYMARS